MMLTASAPLKQNDPCTFTNSWPLPCINKLELPKNPEQRVETANWLHGWSAVRGELSRLLRDRRGIHSGDGPANTARVQSLLATGR